MSFTGTLPLPPGPSAAQFRFAAMNICFQFVDAAVLVCVGIGMRRNTWPAAELVVTMP